MLGSLCTEGSSSLLNLSRSGKEHVFQTPRIPLSFGVIIDSFGLLLPIIVPGYANSSADTDASTMELGEFRFQGPLYACMQDSSELIQSPGQVDPQN
ncbi:hypothetical protein RIF29_29024 [Crotalaria pallida]|uniref:Uncharacterized protein n=1 Tax=Crotalaria pallida TaxID=3830 RepID=A0AAN9HX33_CROPI